MRNSTERRVSQLIAEVQSLRYECSQNRETNDALELSNRLAQQRLERIQELEAAQDKALHVLENKSWFARVRAIRFLQVVRREDP